MSDTYEAFLAEVLAEVPEDSRGAVEGALKSSKKAKDGFLRQSDYSRQMDALTRAQAALESEKQSWEDWYANASQEHAETVEKLNRYQSEFGDLEGGERKPAPPAFDIDKLQKDLAQRDRLAIKFADVLTDLKLDHKDRFGEKLNTDQLIEHATKRGLPIDIAYNELIADKVEAVRQKEIEDRIAKAREEGSREALSRHNLPVSPSPSEVHVLDRTEVKTDPRERVRAAAEAFMRRDAS